MDLSELKFDRQGLVTVVVQDRLTGEVRMLAHADERALRATLASGEGTLLQPFAAGAVAQRRDERACAAHHRSLGGLRRGRRASIWSDPDGPSCHTGRTTCFFRVVERSAEVRDDARNHAPPLLPRLWAELEARKHEASRSSYTRSLLDAGAAKIGAKIREEADELARAITGESAQRVVSEAADEIYHLLVGLLARGVDLRAVEAELARRFGVSGSCRESAHVRRAQRS